VERDHWQVPELSTDICFLEQFDHTSDFNLQHVSPVELFRGLKRALH
jgi:hypothetical protein